VTSCLSGYVDVVSVFTGGKVVRLRFSINRQSETTRSMKSAESNRE